MLTGKGLQVASLILTGPFRGVPRVSFFKTLYAIWRFSESGLLLFFFASFIFWRFPR